MVLAAGAPLSREAALSRPLLSGLWLPPMTCERVVTILLVLRNGGSSFVCWRTDPKEELVHKISRNSQRDWPRDMDFT